MNTPKISVIIPFYNSAAFIEDAIKSVEQQTCDYEAVFVDDGEKCLKRLLRGLNSAIFATNDEYGSSKNICYCAGV